MIQQSIGHITLTQLHISKHMQMHKFKYEPTAFLASSSMSPFEYVKCNRKTCIEKKPLLGQGKNLLHSSPFF